MTPPGTISPSKETAIRTGADILLDLLGKRSRNLTNDFWDSIFQNIS